MEICKLVLQLFDDTVITEKNCLSVLLNNQSICYSVRLYYAIYYNVLFLFNFRPDFLLLDGLY